VDEDYSADDADGDSEKPYETITKALEKSSSGDKIYIKNGTYKENITLKKEVELYGQKRDGVVIQGTIEAKEDNKLKDLTVSGKSYGVVASGKIVIDNCRIKNNSKNGIELLESGSEAIITDSIISGNQKGIYVQRKRSISLAGNSIYKNREEGLDIREKVSGNINKNDISENGEGGIEIIVGGADLKISCNTIKKNKANGIAVQFYSFIEKTGSIDIQNNTLSKNGKYGFGCGIPSGGEPSASYWSNSINLENNTIENNKLKAIDSFCQIIKAVPEEEVEKNATLEDIANPDLVEEKENNETKEQIIRERIAEQMTVNDDFFLQTEELIEKIKEKHRLTRLLFGIKEELDLLRENREKINQQITSFDELLTETKLEENQKSINEALKNLQNKLKDADAFLQQQEKSFNFSDWLSKIFKR
jgi:parallel beta-helix repeat protein